MPHNQEQGVVQGMCQFAGENHIITYPADSTQGKALALDLKHGKGYCPGHDDYSVGPVPVPPETNTASY